MLSMMALLVCVFAVSVSAGDFFGFDDLSNYDASSSENIVFVTSTKILNPADYTYSDFDSSAGRFGIVYITGPYKTVGFININKWHELLTKDNNVVENSSEFDELVSSWADGSILPLDDSWFNTEVSSYRDELFELYQKYIAEISAPTYEDGKTDGVTEYKASEEYENTISEAEQNAIDGYKSSTEYNAVLQGEYNRGKDEAVEAYKSSTAYKNALDIKYSTGLADGKANYIESAEYKEALQVEYDEGFEAGTEESDTSEIGTTLLSIVGSALLGVVVVWLFNTLGNKRKRRR